MSEPIRLAITDPDGVATETLSVTTRDGETWYDRRDTVEALHRLLAEARAQRDAAYNDGVEAAASWVRSNIRARDGQRTIAESIRALKREAGDA